METEHDQLVRLKEKVKIYREWLKNQVIDKDEAETTCFEMREKFNQTFGEK